MQLGKNWNTCAIGERSKEEEKNLDLGSLKPEAILLGYDFSISLNKKNSKRAVEILEIIEKIESLHLNQNSTYIIPSCVNTGCGLGDGK